jgi:hypothetical protein
VLAAIDLIESIEIENTAEEDANENSCIVLGNVSVTTLRTLGFEIHGEDRIVDEIHDGPFGSTEARRILALALVLPVGAFILRRRSS